jgi:hypothetical protein
MALVRTQLTAAIQSSDLFWSVVSTAGFPVIGTIASGNGQPVQVDNELAFLERTVSATVIKVRGRGSDGTVAQFHDVNAPVVTSSTPVDFPLTPPGQYVLHPPAFPDQTSYGSDAAILIPTKDAKAFLTKTSAGAYTLAAPNLANNGIELVISSVSAFAHAITTVALLNTGAAGSPFNTATFPAVAGATLFLEAQNGLWNVVSTNGAVVFT